MIRPWLVQYVDNVKRILRLGDHEVIISEEPADPDNVADIETIPEMAQSTLRVMVDFEQQSPSEIRYYIAHELIHIWFTGFEDVLHAFMPGMSKAERKAFYRAWRRSEEKLVDSIARIVAEGLPLPPDEKQRKKIDAKLFSEE